MKDVIQRRGREWKERLLGLREAVAALYAAEGEALSRDLSSWGKGFAFAIVLLLAALAIGFWLVAVMVGFLVALLALWLPVWAAALITAGVLALAIALLAGIGWKRLQALGGPIARVQRRWRDHLAWWRERVFDSEEEAEDEQQGP